MHPLINVNRRLSSLLVLVTASAFSQVTSADIFSQVNLYGELYDPASETVGGTGVPTAQIASSGAPKVETQLGTFNSSRTISGWAIASAETGRLAFGLSSSISLPADAPAAQLSAFIQSTNNRVIDRFTVGPGTGPDGPLVNGNPARVRLQIRLDARVEQQGRPSGLSEFSFQVRAGDGTVNLPLVADFDTGGLNPPQQFEVHEEWDVVVETTIGSVVSVDSLMSGWINGTAFDPGESGTNSITVDPIARISNAPGYELELSSEAGAPTTPLPVITLFADVLPGYWAFDFIETLGASGITRGCGNGNYCPEDPVTRAQMAVFLERGMNGSDFQPPTASGSVFLDVPVDAFAASFIEQLYLDGITAGCGGGKYCPDNAITRAQMAVFLLRAKHGAAYIPPPPTGTVFGDINLGYWSAAWIEQLAAEGITGGCGGGNYCPEAPVTRAQMAVFLVRTFGL